MAVEHHLVNSNETGRSARRPAACAAAALAALAATVLAAGCAGPDAPRRATEAPPVEGSVLILIDTLRADHLGCYGSDLGLTPVLDGVAARGTLFENAVAPSSWTRSTVASLFASRYPSSIGVLGREDALAPGVLTLAEVLAAAGVETLAISTNRNSGRTFGFAQGFDRFEVPHLTGSYPGDYEIHIAEGVTRKALSFLDDRTPGRPFFLFLHYVDPHDPYLPHPELMGPEPAGRFDGSRRDLDRLDRLTPAEVTAADRERIRHLYAGEVRYCDLWIGELLTGLEERGLRDRVLLAITSDHGEGLWDHGVRGHGRDLYEEQIHVPLILDAPAARDGDRPLRVAAPVSLLDLAPTLLAAHGVASPPEFRGADLWPLVRGERRARRLEYLYAELDLDGRDLEALRHGDRKLIRNRRAAARGAVELYDLAADPGERHDLADRPSTHLARLERALDGVVREVLDDAAEAERVSLADLDRETADSLRALGYLRGGAPRTDGRGGADGLASTLDFGDPDHRVDQLAGGFYELENARRWMSGEAAVLLGRGGGERRWRLDGWIDLGLVGRERLTVTTRAGGGEPQRRTIDRSGFFTLEGPLPEDAGPTVRLDFECDHELVPDKRGGDQRRLCVVVQSIALL